MDSAVSLSGVDNNMNTTESPLLVEENSSSPFVNFMDNTTVIISNHDYDHPVSHSPDPTLQCVWGFLVVTLMLYFCMRSNIPPPEMRRGHVIRAQAIASRRREQQEQVKELQTPQERAYLVRLSLYTKVCYSCSMDGWIVWIVLRVVPSKPALYCVCCCVCSLTQLTKRSILLYV
jgi:hypothetical protein